MAEAATLQRMCCWGRPSVKGRYVGQPTALRAPLYPLLLAALKLGFGGQALLTMRFIQLAVAVLTAWVCSKTAVRLWGEAAK